MSDYNPNQFTPNNGLVVLKSQYEKTLEDEIKALKSELLKLKGHKKWGVAQETTRVWHVEATTEQEALRLFDAVKNRRPDSVEESDTFAWEIIDG